MITTRSQTQLFTNATYAVLMDTDSLGDYFVMQPSWAVSEALNEGWVIVSSDMAYHEARELRQRLYNEDVDVLEYAGVLS